MVVVAASDCAVSSAAKRMVSFEMPAVGEDQVAHRCTRQGEAMAEPLLEDRARVVEVATLVELHQTSAPLFIGVPRISVRPRCFRRMAAHVPTSHESWSSPQAWIPLMR